MRGFYWPVPVLGILENHSTTASSSDYTFITGIHSMTRAIADQSIPSALVLTVINIE
ncbi:MAG: hypothetical protein COB30_011320 [Ectothiorhodospiraceae bacterium]|nr:hypothetical protein [Ectothiorhodospiraceae bacterium]